MIQRAPAIKAPTLYRQSRWGSKLDSVETIQNIDSLPTYAFQFFFRNMGRFRLPFLLLTASGVIATILRFLVVYLLGDIISHISELTIEGFFSFYLPIWLGTYVFCEWIDYFTRKYAEALPLVYADHLTLRFGVTLIGIRSAKLLNFSKERLNILIGKYCDNVRSFLSDWFWNTSRRIAQFVLILIVIGYQSPLVLLVNLIYMAVFLLMSLRISARFAPYARALSEQGVETGGIIQSLTLNLNTLKRLGLTSFFLSSTREAYKASWLKLEDVRSFHARRWFVQLNLFFLIYLGTLAYGIFQVKQGVLALGYLVLIKWAYDQLLLILIYVIEYYVSLVQQKEDCAVIRRTFSEFVPNSNPTLIDHQVDSGWREIALKDVKLSFSPSEDSASSFELKIPSLTIPRGSKIGIVGPSGAGKSTILNALMNLIEFDGDYLIDGNSVKGARLTGDFITPISNSDPLFKMSLKDNILLGRGVSDGELGRILKGVEADEFLKGLDSKVGSSEFNLSSGQEQRVRLARGLVQDSDVYLLDEPFNGIDELTKSKVIEFLRTELRDKTVVLVTHNREELSLVDKVYSLNNGILSLE